MEYLRGRESATFIASKILVTFTHGMNMTVCISEEGVFASLAPIDQVIFRLDVWYFKFGYLRL
jgi:hypothetical protein